MFGANYFGQIYFGQVNAGGGTLSYFLTKLVNATTKFLNGRRITTSVSGFHRTTKRIFQ